MKVLVTGGSGFLGINLIRFLREKGVEEIRVLDIAPFDYPEKGESWLKFTQGDVRDVQAVEKVTDGSIVLMHNGAKNTPAALPQIIKGIRDKGYEIVLIKDLLPEGEYYTDVQGEMHLSE